ncbi:MAG: hypothetical protein JSW00_01605 [Thermoplasmata archaeon]|nr:MAG: hypothetical protein JSW00_01605 [Thermoplasmata archaeon]
MYGSTDAVEMYDPVLETWTSKASMNNARSGLSAEALQGKIYAFGGTGKWGLAANVNEMYDPATDNWTLKPSMLESRVYFGSGVVGNCIYAMGGSYGPLIVDVPNSTEEYCVGDGLVYEWDFDASVDSDGDGDNINDKDATGPNPTHVYGDDGKYIVTLKVTDHQNLSDTDICNITVKNVDPNVYIKSAIMEVEIGLRVAGRKYNNVSMALYEEGNQIGYVSIERLPGSPDEQMAWIPCILDKTKSYSATVTYEPEDPPNVGGNPVWIYIKFKNGSIRRIHHTFNVQQSKKRDSDHWNHVEPWEVDLNGHLIGCPFEVTSHITDPGSDDEILSFTYGSQIKTVTYLNNPPNPDPFPSPEINPMDITDTTTLIYEGPGTLILTVKDDDNLRLGLGQGMDSIGLV